MSSIIKMRIRALPDEAQHMVDKLEQCFEIVSCSGQYADRAPSKYVRVYLDVALKPDAEPERDYSDEILII